MSEILPINIESKPEATNAAGFELVGHKSGDFTRLKLFDANGKLKPEFVNQNVTVNNNTYNNTYNLDPSQIVPSEALYTDETLAGDILKRVDKTTGENVNYRKITKWIDGSDMTDDKVDGVAYLKKGSDYYKIVADLSKPIEVEKFGIVKNNENAAARNSQILKILIKNKIKNLFSVGTYFFDEIIFNEKIDNTYLFSNAKKWDDVYSDEVTRIQVKGNNFIKYRFDGGSNKIYTENILFLGDLTKNCFVREKNNQDFDFTIIGKNLRFHRFNYAFKSESYSTGCILENYILSDNKYGFWSEYASNFSRLTFGRVWGNAVGLNISGFQTLVEQCEIMVNGSSGFHEDKRFGIISNQGTFSHIYGEEYGGTQGMTPDTHVFFYDKGNYFPEIGLTLNDVSFQGFDGNNNPVMTSLLTKSNKEYRIAINCFNPFYMPKIVKNVEGKPMVGISVNGQNLYTDQNVTLMNKREFIITGVKSLSNGYAPYIDGFMTFDVSHVKGIAKLLNYNANGWDKIFDDSAGLPIIGRDSKWSIEFDFIIEANSTNDVVFGVKGNANVFIPLSVSSVKTFNGKNYLQFKGYGEFTYADTNNIGWANFGFKGDLPKSETFKGRIIVKDI